MGKAKRRNFKLKIDDKFKYITREDALKNIVKNIEREDVIDDITLFDFSAEEILEAGASYEDVMALGGFVS